MTEEWRAVPGADGYEVSDHGRVRCWRPKPYSAQPPVEARIVKPRTGTNGYQNVILGFKGKTGQIHRMVAEVFVAGQSAGLEVAHENGDRLDNRATNLAWKTRRENIADKRRHGTHGKTLTEDSVEEIRNSYIPGVTTYVYLAHRYGLTPSYVGKIIRRQSWSNAA